MPIALVHRLLSMFHTHWLIRVQLAALVAFATVAISNGDDAIVRGKIQFDPAQAESWDGNQLVIPLNEISANLRERIIFLPPYPAESKSWTPEQRLDWERKFIDSEAGKKYLAKRKEKFDSAKVFEIKMEKDGSFVVFDVPPGVYGIQGRADKKIGDTKYAFEVFGQIEVLDDVDELDLKPIGLFVTPILEAQQTAPPFKVSTHDDEAQLTRETFKDHAFLFLNFWTANSPISISEQKKVQEMATQLESDGLKLLSINVDVDRKQVLDFIGKNHMKQGGHGFTGGLNHPSLFNYGVRGVPSFWLIGQDGTILMTQYEFANAMRDEPDLAKIVKAQIQDDAPKPADSK